MESTDVVLLGFRIFMTVGTVVGLTAGLWAIYRGHIRTGLVACVFCVPYAYFLMFEPKIRPTRMEPKGDRRRNIAVMALVIILMMAFIYVQFINPPLPPTD